MAEITRNARGPKKRCRACGRHRKRIWRGWCRWCVEDGMSMVKGHDVWVENRGGGIDGSYCEMDITIGELNEKD